MTSDSSLSIARPVPGRVSVIVPTRDSARTLEACLASIRAQTYRNVELVVVDNTSADASQQIAERFTSQVIVTGPERSAQRNAGAKVASGEFLVFVDGDMLMSADVADEVAKAFGRDGAIQSIVVPLRSVGENFWARCRALEKDLYVGDPQMEAARAFRRDAFEKVGGYDEGLHAGEDWDLSERVIKAGSAVGRVSAEIVHDEGWVGLRELLAKKRYYGGTLVRYVRKHPGLAMRQIIRVAFVRNARILLHDPLLGLGLLLMKALEFVAALVGAAMSVAGHSPTATGSRR